jgi:menaquinone-dependent protoporphyrinogen oxidase
MRRILVVFGTTEGHTRRVAECLGDVFHAHGIAADLVEAGTVDVSPGLYKGVVVCASVHGGRYQRNVRRWVADHATDLSVTPNAFVSVCLAVLEKDPKVRNELDAIVARFVTATGWQPASVKHVAGALPYRKYGIVKRWVMKRIVAKAGGDTDTSRNYEYTDWADLRAFASEFVRHVAVLAGHSQPWTPSETVQSPDGHASCSTVV